MTPLRVFSVSIMELFFDKSLARLRNTSIQRRQSPIDVSITSCFGFASFSVVDEELSIVSGEGLPLETEDTKWEATKRWKSSERTLYSVLE